MTGGMSDVDTQIVQEVIVELRMIQKRNAIPGAKCANSRSADVRAQAAIWTRKAELFGWIADRAERTIAERQDMETAAASIIAEIEGTAC